MLNFQDLHLFVSDTYSFVGIKRSEDQLKFYLPRGFEISKLGDYSSKRDIYFLLYKVLHLYKDISIQKGMLCPVDDRDGIIQHKHGTQRLSLHNNSETPEVLLYSKLDGITAILDIYDEPKILSLAYRLYEDSEIDYSQIHQYWDRAKYLNGNVVYIDSMDIPKTQVRYQSNDIVCMYAYILWEIKQQLNEDMSPEMRALAEDFGTRYLSSYHSLFSEEYCTETADILKDTLDLIEHRTPIKDIDFYDYHDAIALFLYGDLSHEDGEVWGISNFHAVWESMCLSYIVNTIPAKYLLYLDENNLAPDAQNLLRNKTKILDITNTFIINGKKLRPDAVLFHHPFHNFELNQNEIESLSIVNDFRIYSGNWDDYFYKTEFFTNANIPSYYKNHKPLRIAYKEQPIESHTTNELNKVYHGQWNGFINHRLNKKFYSYWNVDLDNINQEELAFMYMVNHVFYIAIENDIYNANDFSNFLEQRFDITQKDNVFNKSLFREVSCYPNTLKLTLASYFEKFINKLFYFNIIDIKYMTLDNFDSDVILDDSNNLKNNKLQHIKESSIRKQFVYEYLLQQRIEKDNRFNQLQINSDFWLPSVWNSRKAILRKESVYLNGYIGLNKINFIKVANSFLS